MFEGFRAIDADIGGTTIRARVGGNGPPLLLLHGFPQTHVMWHKIAPALAQHFTVVAADLRGYGDSGKPASDTEHSAYSKRAMAGDQVRLMQSLGFSRYRVVAHDRGARVAHRMALDHADAVTRLALLDIVPTRDVFAAVNQQIAIGFYHWFFLIQPEPLPETLIGHDPEFYLRSKVTKWAADPAAFAPEAMAEYLRCYRDPACIHASCEDYRAAASIDLRHDEADLDRRIECPLLVLWGEYGRLDKNFDVLALWRASAGDVRGGGVPCGHFLAEEKPEETLAQLLPFLIPS